MPDLYFQRCQSLGYFAVKSKPAVIAISESWLDDSVLDGEVSIDGYSLQRNDRNRQGGGVCLYIHNRYAYTTLTDIVTDGLESLWINVLLPKTKPIQVGVCYRPPTQSNFIELFNNSLSHLRSDCETYILGDINIDFPSSHPLFSAYKQELNLFDLSQLIDEPTRVTDSSRTTIDHILTNRPDNILQHGVIPTGLSDHYLIFCSRRISKGHFKNHSTVKVRSLKSYSSDILLEKLCSVDWKPCFLSDCVNIAWTMFRTSFMNILDECLGLNLIYPVDNNLYISIMYHQTQVM